MSGKQHRTIMNNPGHNGQAMSQRYAAERDTGATELGMRMQQGRD